MTHRIEQAESLMQRAIAQVLQRDVSDPRIQGMVSITKVDISPDMRQAKVGVTVIPEQYEKRTLAGLQAAARHIHGKVKKLVALRTVPHLSFVIDEVVKRESAVLQAIDAGMRRTRETQEQHPPDEQEQAS